MKIPNFVYRIVNVKKDGYYVYYLHEDNGNFYFISKYPSSCFGYSEEDIQKKIVLYEAALKLPAINYEDIKEYTSENVPPPDNEVKNFKY
jgi:hypothetical protein